MTPVSVLVAYASKHGATQGIAERIAKTLESRGFRVETRPARNVGDPTGFDAFVIGSAAYMGSWMKEATGFAESHAATVRGRPVWLFSSGPLGTSPTDAQGRDVLVTSEPKEFTTLKELLNPRGTRVFFGALDISKLGFFGRLTMKMPAARSEIPEGDFRDWQAIDAWANSIADELASVPVREAAPTV